MRGLQGQLVDVEQGSDAWHDLRAPRIGASETAALFQKSPYFTTRELFLFKKGRVPEWFMQEGSEYIFEKGHEFEEKMRAEYFALTGMPFKPTVRISKKYPHLIVSLDGELGNNIMETKLVGEEVLAEIIAMNKPPEHHWIQVQTQLLVTKAEKCIYFAHTLDGEAAIVDVFPDPVFQRHLLKTSIQFARKVKNNEEPPMSKEDFHFADPSPVFDELRELNEKKSAAKKVYESLEAEYKTSLKDFHATFGQRNVASLTQKVKIKTMSRETIKWLTIPEVAALSQEYINKFKTAGTEYVQAWFSKK